MPTPQDMDTSAPFLLLATVDARAAAHDDLRRLWRSIERQGRATSMVLVARGAEDLPPLPAFPVQVVRAERPLGLSAARNLALSAARESGWLASAALVAFPDDDCWYPDGTLAQVASAASGHSIVCGAYGPSPSEVDRARFPLAAGPLTLKVAVGAASSVTTFYAAEVVREVGQMDPGLGVGTPLGSSEDVDYLLRALGTGATGCYDGAIVVGHAYAPASGRYWAGSVSVLARYVRSHRTGWLLARRLALGALMVTRRQLPLGDFLRGGGVSLRTAVRAATRPSRRPLCPDRDDLLQN